MKQTAQVDVIILSWNRLEDTQAAIRNAAAQLGVRAQIRGLPLLLLCTAGMSLAVLAIGWVVADWQPLMKLSAMMAVGAMSYPLLLWFADRALILRILAFVGAARRRTV